MAQGWHKDDTFCTSVPVLQRTLLHDSPGGVSSCWTGLPTSPSRHKSYRLELRLLPGCRPDFSGIRNIPIIWSFVHLEHGELKMRGPERFPQERQAGAGDNRRLEFKWSQVIKGFFNTVLREEGLLPWFHRRWTYDDLWGVWTCWWCFLL